MYGRKGRVYSIAHTHRTAFVSTIITYLDLALAAPKHIALMSGEQTSC